MAAQKRKDPLVWGVILILFGALFLLQEVNVDIWDNVAKLWPLAIIAWGVWKLYFGLKERQEKPQERQGPQ